MPRTTIPQRAIDATSARLATVGPHGPHLVPIVFAIIGDRLVTAVDHKPKSTRRLRRLDNIAHNAAVSVLIDQYDDDWDQLWWVRLDGEAGVVDDDRAAIDALVAKYPHYAAHRPAGPVIRVDITHIASWTSAS